jgi:LysR family transcriptional regulator, chromosome initiation inhibitor
MGIIENPLLDAFQAVVETGTVHSAAKKIGVTQTAVTKRIKALENALQMTTFLRSRRGMSLTDEGKALLQHCRAVQDLEGTFLSRISGKAKDEIQLTIIGPTSAISTRIARDCQALYEKHPYLRLHLQSDDHSNLIDLVRKGSADLAIIPPTDVPREMHSKLLQSDRYVLVACSAWKRRPLKDIVENERIIDFYESDQTTRRYLKKFNLESHVKKSRLYVNENQALVRFFSEGVGFGTLTTEVARPYLDSGELITLNGGHSMEDPLALTWYPRVQKAVYFSNLVRSIK